MINLARLELEFLTATSPPPLPHPTAYNAGEMGPNLKMGNTIRVFMIH